MADRARGVRLAKPSLAFVLLCLFLVVLWLAGGASRADVAGQLMVRGAAWGAIIVMILFGPRVELGRYKAVGLLLGAALVVALLQLVPLPPSLWRVLPGREAVAVVDQWTGGAPPWRPLSLVPSATINAAASLVVPVAMLLLLAGLKPAEAERLPTLLLGLIGVSALLGLLQLSGAAIDNPFVNDTGGSVSGPFANRNHFALFVGFGCLLAPVWAFLDDEGISWRGPLAAALVAMFALIVLAVGSRAGALLGFAGALIGVLLVQRRVRRQLRHRQRWVFAAGIAIALLALAALVLLSVTYGRALSIERLFSPELGMDMRRRGFPVVWEMVRTYFPAGSGLGGFDPVFRMHEPFALLKPGYFNHAHNDLLEVVLDAGIAGVLLLLAALSWWLWASVRAWLNAGASGDLVPRLGSALLLLVIVASVFDYPARTPLMMAVIVIAASWLTGKSSASNALPRSGQHL